MKLIIDADACPKSVLDYVLKFSEDNFLECITVANFNHLIKSRRHICVGDDSQAADIKILNLTKILDIVITQDFGLAAMIVAKKAFAISPTGLVFNSVNIDFMLEERALKAKIRMSGGRTKGPSKRSKADTLHFIESLNSVYKKVLTTATIDKL